MADHGSYTVERSATIAATPEQVYDQLIDFHQWMNWSPWEDLDPELERTFSGPQSGVGASYAWSGNRKAGRGRMEITEASAPTDIDIALTFEKPFKSANTTWFRLQPEGAAGTKVTWTMTGPHSRMTKIMGIFKSKDFDKGLARLKAVTETPAT